MFAASDRDNLPVGEMRALKQLQNMPNIIIEAANKGGAMVVLSRQQYLEQGFWQLTDPKFYTKHDTTELHQTRSMTSLWPRFRMAKLTLLSMTIS